MQHKKQAFAKITTQIDIAIDNNFTLSKINYIFDEFKMELLH